ncbi:MAG: 3-deoxy-D-manno-octulosonic acid transferase [Bacteroidota bacterium]|nr:3-deoxy-D-manno-octulosonic acid transferase [Bacteroidota bacterium]
MPVLLRLIYNTGILLYGMGVRLAALKNPKAKLWVKGRKGIFKEIEKSVDRNEKRLWFHAASLGEFEQGRPLIELIKAHHPDHKIVLTFFSPSGYEVRKNYGVADHVFYLPLDTPANAAQFIGLIKPQFAIFIKYEYWYNYFNTLKRQSIPLFMLSAAFRPEQPFFRKTGSLHREMLGCVNHFFVQDEASGKLLQESGFSNYTIVPDTRIDRVWQISRKAEQLPVIEDFLNGEKAIIAGSIYKAENDILVSAFREGHIHGKIILVPHSVDENTLHEIEKSWGGHITRYSRWGAGDDKQVLLVDVIGLLSGIYQYGSTAIIGGGFGKSIHNILEPAAFGLPVLFGPNFHKFREAQELIEMGGAATFDNPEVLRSYLAKLADTEKRMEMGAISANYIDRNTGGTEIVYRWLQNNGLLKPNTGPAEIL